MNLLTIQAAVPSVMDKQKTEFHILLGWMTKSTEKKTVQ